MPRVTEIDGDAVEYLPPTTQSTALNDRCIVRHLLPEDRRKVSANQRRTFARLKSALRVTEFNSGSPEFVRQTRLFLLMAREFVHTLRQFAR